MAKPTASNAKSIRTANVLPEIYKHTTVKDFIKHALRRALWTQQKGLGLRFTMMYSPSANTKRYLIRHTIVVLSFKNSTGGKKRPHRFFIKRKSHRLTRVEKPPEPWPMPVRAKPYGEHSEGFFFLSAA